VGIQKTPTQLVRATDKLPAGGLFDTTAPAIPCGASTGGVLYITQQLGGAGSAGQYLVELSPDGEESVTPRWYTALLSQGPGVVLAGVGLAVPQYRWIAPLESGTFLVSYPLPYLGGARQFRVRFAEYGNVAAGQQSTLGALAVLRAEQF